MSNGTEYLFGPFQLDVNRRALLRDGQPVPITGKVFDTLLFLIERRDRVVSKDEILEGVWPDAVVEEANLTQSISVLRRSLGEKAGDNKYIVTVAGRGYQFAAAIGQPTNVPDQPDEVPHWRRRSVLAVSVAIAVLGVLALVRTFRARGTTIPATVRLTSLPGVETQPAFSPDGKQVAFAWSGDRDDNQDIYVTLVGTDSILRLTTDPASDSSPAWSPDGQYIAFYRNGTRPAYFAVPAIGGPERRIADGQAGGKSIGRKMVWSPDGKVLFIAEPPNANAPRRIMGVSVATGEKHSITRPGRQMLEEDPAISPDGSQLAFVRGCVELFVMKLDGSGERSLAMGTGIRGVTWTPNSRDIVFAMMRNSGNNLWKVEASGSGRPELISGVAGEASFPSISPDGRKLVYSESRLNSNIWRLDVRDEVSRDDDALDTRLIYSTKSQYSPQISPDGRRITFASDRSGSREIWICDQDGRNARQLTFYGGAHTGTPRWSPDGRSIVYDSHATNNADIYVIAAEGGTPRNLTKHPAKDVTPSYSRDGRWMYFSSNRSGTMQVWRMSAGGGEAVQITRNGGGGAIESYDGRFIYYSKFNADHPGLFRVPKNGGEEAVVIEQIGAWGWWTLTEGGVYFIEHSRGEQTARLLFAPFSGKNRTIRTLPTVPSDAENVLSADQSGGTLLLEQIDESFGDLMMVEGFR